MKKIILVFILLLVVGCGEKKSENSIVPPEITASEVNEMITNSDDFILLDVRTKAEYDSAHIKGAVNIPLDELESATTLDKSAKIVVYCQSGNRSLMAAKKLIENGYLEVYDLGGIIEWTYEMESN